MTPPETPWNLLLWLVALSLLVGGLVVLAVAG